MLFSYQWDSITLFIETTSLDEGHDYEFDSITLEDSEIDIQDLILSSPVILEAIDKYYWDNLEKFVKDHENFMRD